MSPRRQASSPVARGLIPACILILIAAMGYLWAGTPRVVRAERALGCRNFRDALVLAAEELRANPGSDRALAVAGTACLALNDAATAEAYFRRIGRLDPASYRLALQALGRIALNSGQAIAAEELLRSSLELDTNDATTRDQLIYLLTLEGRDWEARQWILEQFRSGTVTINYLTAVNAHHPSLESATKYARHCLLAVPKEPLPNLALAQQAMKDNRQDVARTLVEQVLEKHPEVIEAQAMYCHLLAEIGTAEEFDQVFQSLPKAALQHPDVWLSRGDWAVKCGFKTTAARCYWEALRRDPNLADANYLLSQSLVGLGELATARHFAERAQRLTTLSLEISSLAGQQNEVAIHAIVNELVALGRVWEAAGWCQTIRQSTGSGPKWAREAERRLYPRLMACATYTEPSLSPAHQIDLSHYSFKNDPINSPQRSSDAARPAMGSIKFAEESTGVGLAFNYLNGAEPGDTESMLEMNGGGVAVLDYDGDGWPDVYFTQGGPLPPAASDAKLSDQLFRNSSRDSGAFARDRSFVSVTVAAGLRDRGYGQGVTVGDFDNDGFPDLYVGNIGIPGNNKSANELYRNNGDGTFADMTDSSGTQSGGWTSSCVMADFNGDGLPDLYVVTYLGGDKIFQPCQKRAHPRCSPLMFPAEPDHLFLNLGDGRFRDVTESCGLVAAEGRGLGVVAADFDDSGRLSLFVANDMSPNFFFRNRTTVPTELAFEEQGLLSGLALDHAGQSKACMGVAAGDYNRDGRLDLFVTNFYRQTNDLFTQQPDGFFRDLSRESKLAGPGFLQLGWGTQFLDADLDGDPDLIVTNGHVHDPLDPGVPFAMPPQFFRNRGNGTFDELPGLQLGDFFTRKWHGRSLARLDWNRDGKEDICILHLNQPVALLTNRTEQEGHFLNLRLVGVDGARDAIGAKVRVTVGETTWKRQLTAGDGFHASNERRLVIGLGEQLLIDTVEVDWPSGSRQQFSALELDREWLLIEHRQPVEFSEEEF